MRERPNPVAKEFGARLRAWRTAERLTLDDLASLLRINAMQLARVEQGRDNDDLAASWPRIVSDLRRLGFN